LREAVDARHDHHVSGGEAVEHSAKLNTPLLRQITNGEPIISTDGTIIGSSARALRDGGSRPHIGAMHLDLSDEVTAALIQELHNIVEHDRYPFSPRIRTLRGRRRQAQAGASDRTPPTRKDPP
jgi:hypothetical protein